MRTRFTLAAIALLGLGVAACADRLENPQAPSEPALSQEREQIGTDVPFTRFSPRGPAAGLKLIADGLTSPLTLEEAPDGSGRLFIVDQIGLIWIVDPARGLLSEPFLDIRDQIVPLRTGFDERGLLGLEFHPQYATNGRFFVYYSAPLRPDAPAGFDHTARISAFRVSSTNADRANPGSERIILEVDEPQFNHNGGTLEFGPADGYLYISLGDGGGANDVGLGHVEDWYEVNAGGNGQDVEQNLLGNILRIDVDGGSPYAIPPDNPFVGRAGLDEIWAYGLRNPYRMSFDMAPPHILLAGDAGQRLAEEVNLIVKGGNYGWNVKEGFYCFNAANNLQPLPDCPHFVGAGHPAAGAPLLPPLIVYPNHANPFEHGLGLVVVGGYVYRGDLLPRFEGRYIFGDFSEHRGEPAGRVFIFRPRISLPEQLPRIDRPGQLLRLWSFQELRFPRQPRGEFGHFLKGFGQDLNGEVYLMGSLEMGPVGNTGKVFLLTPVSGI